MYSNRVKPEQPVGRKAREKYYNMLLRFPTTQPQGPCKDNSSRNVGTSQRPSCIRAPPPSLQSQSFPKISVQRHPARHHHHCDNSLPNHCLLKKDMGIFSQTTHSLPSLMHSHGPCKTTSRWRTKAISPRYFEVFKTSEHEHYKQQNFAWDFLPMRDGVTKGSAEAGIQTDQTPRPVHLYMSIDLMDELLGKPKELRSDKTLNELVGLPPVQDSQETNIAQKDYHSTKHKRKKDTKKPAGVHQRNAAEFESGRQAAKENDSGKRAMAEASTLSKKALTKTKVLSNKKTSEAPCQQTFSEAVYPDEDVEFQDEEEEELEGLCNESGSDVFDGCEDDEYEEDEVLDEDDQESGGDDEEHDGYTCTEMGEDYQHVKEDGGNNEDDKDINGSRTMDDASEDSEYNDDGDECELDNQSDYIISHTDSDNEEP